MSLLFMDGVDHYTTVLQKWDTVLNVNISTSLGRFGGGALVPITANSSYLVTKAIPTLSAGVLGVAGKATTTTGNIAGFLDVANLQIWIAAVNGYLNVYRGTTLIGQSATPVVTAGTWNYYELKVVLHHTAGSVEVRMNGVTQISLTGIDTTNTANESADGVYVGAKSTVVCMTTYDDFYVCNTGGSTCNNFLGDVRISTIFPSADGSNSGFASTGANQYSVIDETAPNDDTDYLYSSTVTARSTINMQDASISGGIVHAVQSNVFARKDDVDIRGIKPVVKSGATYAQGSEATLSTSYVYSRHAFELDPNTSTAWTETTVNAAEFGVDLTT